MTCLHIDRSVSHCCHFEFDNVRIDESESKLVDSEVVSDEESKMNESKATGERESESRSDISTRQVFINEPTI